jgi:Spy/CpxP family protein refolding chaperone
MQKAGKGSLLLVMALILSLGLATSVWAQAEDYARSTNMTPEQAGQYFDLKEKFNSDTAPLRRQMMVKRAEFEALRKAKEPDKDAMQAKQKELTELREQLQEKMTAFQKEAQKVSPSLGDMGMGMDKRRGMGPPRGMRPGGPPAPGGAPAPAPPQQ